MTKQHVPNEPHILWFRDLSIDDVALVGGKNAALGEMIGEVSTLGVKVPDGFAVTAHAYNYFLDHTGIRSRIETTLKDINTHDMDELATRGNQVRRMIREAELPDDLRQAIINGYAKLVEAYGTRDVAVRSSATAEDLPDASFAGQQETYLNVAGEEAVLAATRNCMASLFTNRAISYRADKGFGQTDIALSVGIQNMVRSDLGASGVMFTIDTETGFEDVVMIEGSYGLGEMVVQGKVNPDSFTVFKPALKRGLPGLIGKNLGSKHVKMIYGDEGGMVVGVLDEERGQYCLSDDEVTQLAQWGVLIEEHFSRKHNRAQPMDMEWAKDGITGELFIVQARPETVHATRDKNVYEEYRLTQPPQDAQVLARGVAVGTKIASGPARVIKDASGINAFKKGEVLVTEITDPDWEPIMKIASAIVTDKGGRTSHAAIVSRELGIPCIVGTEDATTRLKTGAQVTVDCSSGQTGVVYKGALAFIRDEHRLDEVPRLSTNVMVNIGSPHEAFKNHRLPVKGVGLGRLEFIITSHIRIHPNALIEYASLKEKTGDEAAQCVVREIDELARGYDDKRQFYIDELAEGVASIAAAFYPRDVIIRFSDFKTNEYRTLVGGELYEPNEQNPMIGWRGASRYYDERFREAFGLECAALKKVRTQMGLENVVPMVPFCRTLEEARKTLAVMEQHGLRRGGESDLKVYVMCEVPSNVILAEEFLELFDGMSIGSNDLTQLVLGLDRDNAALAGVGNEKNAAVLQMMDIVIHACQKAGKYIGICGQAPSDFPEVTAFLVEQGIDSISLSPDTVIKTLPMIAQQERALGRTPGGAAAQTREREAGAQPGPEQGQTRHKAQPHAQDVAPQPAQRDERGAQNASGEKHMPIKVV